MSFIHCRVPKGTENSRCSVKSVTHRRGTTSMDLLPTDNTVQNYVGLLAIQSLLAHVQLFLRDPQLLFRKAVSLSACIVAWVYSSSDARFHIFVFHEIPVGPFLQSAKVLLYGSPTFQGIERSSQFAGKLVENVVCSFIQVFNRETKHCSSQRDTTIYCNQKSYFTSLITTC